MALPRQVSDDERRARLGIRQALAPSHRAADAVGAARATVALHSTEPASVVLSALSRTDDLTAEDMVAAFDRGELVRQVSMRRTLFGLPRDLLPAALGSICTRMATRARNELVKGAAAAGKTDPERWVERAVDAVEAELEASAPLTAAEIRERVPAADGRYPQGAGTKWASMVQLAPRVVLLAAMQGRVVRCGEHPDWRISRPTWTTMRRRLGEVAPLDERSGYAELVRRWLAKHGPGTVEDVAWWLGATKGAVRMALGDVDAVEVRLASGATGWLLPDDAGPVDDPGPWVALLPVLDPAIMGWRDRDFLLGRHAPLLFDSVGNAGTTAWVDGRVVGVWVQDDAGRVEVRLLEQVPTPARDALEDEAARLTGWLEGRRVFPVYPSPAMRQAR